MLRAKYVDFEYRYANPAALAITGMKSLRELKGVSLLTRLPLARDHPRALPSIRGSAHDRRAFADRITS